MNTIEKCRRIFKNWNVENNFVIDFLTNENLDRIAKNLDIVFLVDFDQKSSFRRVVLDFWNFVNEIFCLKFCVNEIFQKSSLFVILLFYRCVQTIEIEIRIRCHFFKLEFIKHAFDQNIEFFF